jgi:hypothetical protein
MKIDVLILIMSCMSTGDRRDACRETWLRRRNPLDGSDPGTPGWYLPPGMDAKFVIGRLGCPSALVGDILYVDAPDTYVGLAQKTWKMCQEALSLWEFNWLFKSDDDTLVNPLRVREYPKTRDYIGRKVNDGWCSGPDTYRAANWHRLVVPKRELIGKVNQAEIDKIALNGWQSQNWAGGGWGYFLSKRAVRMVAEEPLAHVEKELYEDKFVGGVMNSYGIYLHGKHETLRDFDYGENIYGATTIHPLKPSAMREVYWKLHRAGEIGT